jgi:hypothetical protein
MILTDGKKVMRLEIGEVPTFAMRMPVSDQIPKPK